MRKLSSYYKQLQTEKNIPVKGVAHKDIKRKLQLKLGGESLFYQESRTQSEFVYHKSVPIKEDERSWFFMNIEEKGTKTAEIIREEIVKGPSSFLRWAPYAEEMDDKCVVMPVLLQLFIEILLSKNHPVSQRVSRMTNSIRQDIICNLTKGNQKTVKHVQLSIVTKRKTGSKFMINSLNRFGHSVLYDEVSNIETIVAEMQANEQSHQSLVPNNIQPATFITFVYDNCDRNPEKISGISVHCTNGIIIQAPGLPRKTSSSEIMCEASTRPGKRSFKALTNNNKPVYR